MSQRIRLPVFAATLLCCSIIGSATARLYGVNYSIRNGPDWASDDVRCKSFEQVTTELQQLQQLVTDNVRIYSMTDCNTADVVLSITQQLGMKVWLGIWVGLNEFNFETERTRMLELMNIYDFTTNVIGIHVSSEAIYREEITVDQAIALRNIIKQDFVTKGWTNIPVTVADIIDTNIEFPALITVDESVVTFNQFPFWENTVDISQAATYMSDRVSLVEVQAGGRQIIVTETGWADAGSNPDANVASPSSMAKWLQDFICLASTRNWQYFWFDAYDSDWRRVNENNPTDVEGHFGIFYQNGTIKPHLQDLTLVCDGNPIPVTPTAPPTNVTISTLSPTSVPISTLNTTQPASAFPSSVPVLDVVDTPTNLPTTLEPTMTPTAEQVSDEPTATPIESSSSEPIMGESSVPSTVPSDTPTFVDAASCLSNPVCFELELFGQCCPTPEGVTLLCCGDGSVEETCALNEQCVVFELEDGNCCPTQHEDIPEIHNKYLDCCTVLPDECKVDVNSTEEENAARCQFMSTVDYKILYQQFNQASRSDADAPIFQRTYLFTMTMVVGSSFLITAVIQQLVA